MSSYSHFLSSTFEKLPSGLIFPIEKETCKINEKEYCATLNDLSFFLFIQNTIEPIVYWCLIETMQKHQENVFDRTFVSTTGGAWA